jgi:DNA modification methylase
VGDFRTVLQDLEPDSVDLILTDPPYDKASIPLYGALAEFAARVLRPGGSLVVYCGQYALFEIGPLMAANLRYQWCFDVRHSGGRRRLHGWRVGVGWKPLLWFVQGRYEGEYVHDALDSQANDKGDHDWAQGHAEATYLIEHLCPVGGLVVDPFAGGGTTLLVARRAGRGNRPGTCCHRQQHH